MSIRIIATTYCTHCEVYGLQFLVKGQERDPCWACGSSWHIMTVNTTEEGVAV